LKTIKLLGITILLLVLTNITLANFALDDSAVVSDLTSEITSLKHANVILNSEVATRGSLTLAIQRVEEQGFIAAPTVATLARPGVVALR